MSKKGLQNGGREDDLVVARVVVGVHRLGRHVPLVPIDRLAEARQVVGVFEGAGPLQVAHQIVGANGDGAVVLPLVRVAYLGSELGELLEACVLVAGDIQSSSWMLWP